MTLTRTLSTLSLAVISTLAVPYATAQDYDALNDSMWYVGANIGQSFAHANTNRILDTAIFSGATSAAIHKDDRDLAFKLFGGYQFNKYFAVEGGYFDFGRFYNSVTTTPPGSLTDTARVRGVEMDVLGIWPISDSFSAFGRVGANYSWAKDSFSSSGIITVGNPDFSKHDLSYNFGLGLQLQLTDSLAMRLEGQRYRVKDGIGNRENVDLVSVGLLYQFGERRHARPHYAAPEPVPAPAPVVTPAPVAPAPMKVTFSADAMFDFNKSNLKPGGKQALDEFARKLQGMHFDLITVTGHTDRIGAHNYNMKLSGRRADTVKRYLMESAGIPDNRINAVGVDGRDPITKPNECKGKKVTPALKACLQPDRRVEVEVTGIQ